MFHLKVDSKPAREALARMPRGVKPAMSGLRKPLRADQRDHAKKQEGPGGAWQKRKPLVIVAKSDRRRRLGKKSRRPSNRRKLLGRLPAAVTVRSDRLSVSITSKVGWSLVHQEGGRAGKGAKIPARPFLWVSDKMRADAARYIEQNVVDAFNQRF